MSQELDEIQWRNPEWINQFGLNTGNVLEYFSESPFYDRTSNNQVLKMQFQYQPPPPNLNTPLEYTRYFESKLMEMVGIEFVVAYIREPDFWVIKKQNRLNRDSVQVLQSYFIIGANIYQAPTLYKILGSRLLSSTYFIKNTIRSLNDLAEFKYDEDSKVDSTTNSNTQTPFTPSAMGEKKEINFDSMLNDALNKR